MQNWDFFGTKFGLWSHLGPSPKFGTSLEGLYQVNSNSPAFPRLWCVSLQPPSKGSTNTKGADHHQSTDHTPYLFPPDSPPMEAPFLINGIGKPHSPLHLPPFPLPHSRPSLMLVTVLGIALALWLVALGMLILGVFSSDTSFPPSPRPIVPRLLNSSHMEEVNKNSLQKISVDSLFSTQLFNVHTRSDGGRKPSQLCEHKVQGAGHRRSAKHFLQWRTEENLLRWTTEENLL